MGLLEKVPNDSENSPKNWFLTDEDDARKIAGLIVKARRDQEDIDEKNTKKCWKSLHALERAEGTARYVEYHLARQLDFKTEKAIIENMRRQLLINGDFYYETGALIFKLVEILEATEDWQTKIEDGASATDVLERALSSP